MQHLLVQLFISMCTKKHQPHHNDIGTIFATQQKISYQCYIKIDAGYHTNNKTFGHNTHYLHPDYLIK